MIFNTGHGHKKKNTCKLLFYSTDWEGRTGKYLTQDHKIQAFPDQLSSTSRAPSTSAFTLVFGSAD